MRTERVILSVTGPIVVSALLLGCAASQRKGSSIAKNPSEPSSTHAHTAAAATTTRQKHRSLKVDMKAYWESCLKKYGVDDFSTEHLIKLLDNESPAIRGASAELLGERKETSAIPRLEEALNDKSPAVRVGVTSALLKMGNRKGIPVLQEYVERVSREVEEGNGEKAVEQLDALVVLADAGEVSAIPYLRKLLEYDGSWGVRIGAIESLAKLYEKDPSVLTDIASMQSDKHPQVRAEAARIFQRIEQRK